ncbi:MAG: DUF2889 domain-containing protein [Polaromonas sp.]|nr:DUF2889 domain-containing protein [Polaromonas sp.]
MENPAKAETVPVVGRRALHTRCIEMTGYERDDGLYEVEGRLRDTKTTLFKTGDGSTLNPGEPIHQMWIRLVYDEQMLVHDIFSGTEFAPYAECANAPAALQKLRGLSMKAGWSQEIRLRLGGALGCTHLAQMLQPMATTAFQTLSRIRLSKPSPLDPSGRPYKIDSCWTFSAGGDVVKQRWPQFARSE